MSPTALEPKDLIVLVADIQQEKTLATLLEARCESLRIRKPTHDIFPHPERDPGVYAKAGNFLNVFVNQFRYALVLLDAAWEGSPASANEIANKIQNDLNRNGWENRSAVVVIDPELEIWVRIGKRYALSRVSAVVGAQTNPSQINPKNCWKTFCRKPINVAPPRSLSNLRKAWG